MKLRNRHFLSIADYDRDELELVLDVAQEQKKRLRSGKALDPIMAGRTLGCIFHKPSLRTRVSFEVAMHQLGGSSLYLTDKELGIGSREAPQDVARVLSRYLAAVMIRTFDHGIAEKLATFSSIPVINGLTDLLHPCQILADLQTIREHRGHLKDLTVVFVGDGNNVARSWLNAAAKLSFKLVLACPEGYGIEQSFVDEAVGKQSDLYEVVHDPHAAVRKADVIYTDVWASMGQEEETAARKKAFLEFQVNRALLDASPSHSVVLHCLPAHRDEEITDEVMESDRSLVFDEAENRLHVQRALLTLLAANPENSG